MEIGIEAIIAILYLFIGAIHLGVYTMKIIKRSELIHPMDPIIVYFVWPLVDVIWLSGRAKSQTK